MVKKMHYMRDILNIKLIKLKKYSNMLTVTQHDFFEEMKKMYSYSELVEWMTSELSITKPTAYNYLHGKRRMNFDSMVLLMNSDCGQKGFNTNEAIYSSQKGIVWNYHESVSADCDSKKYLLKLNEQIHKLNPDEQSLNFVTAELPIIYYMYFPALIGFKLFCWSKTVWSTDKGDSPFVLSNIVDSSDELVLKDIVNHFSRFNTFEFWNANMLDTTMKQIRYFRQMEWFKSIKDYIELVDEIRRLVVLLQKFVENGQKLDFLQNQSNGESLIYDNDIYFANNIYMVRGVNREVVFTSFDDPNYMTTTSRNMVSKSIEWIDGMKKHSISLTGNRGVFRKQFFDQLNNQIDHFDNF